MSDEPAGDALPALPPLDRLYEHRVRLAIGVLLASRDALSFRRLRDVLEETDGSLGAHLRRLEEAEYVSITKTHEGRTPATYVELSDTGRAALDRYTRALRELLGGTL